MMLERGACLVRPVLTLAFAATVIYLAVTDKVSPEFLVGMANGIIAFWFGERAGASIPQQIKPPKQES